MHVTLMPVPFLYQRPELALETLTEGLCDLQVLGVPRANRYCTGCMTTMPSRHRKVSFHRRDRFSGVLTPKNRCDQNSLRIVDDRNDSIRRRMSFFLR